MKAVVLVGGFGTRLRPLTLDRPKQMLPIIDRPMIEHALAHLNEHGVDEVALSMGYRPDAFIDRYPDGKCAGVKLHFAVEPEPLDTAGAVRFAALEAGIDETFVVINADVLTDIDVSELIEFHCDRQAEGTIALHQVNDPSAFGVVPIDGDGRVEAFVEKPSKEEAPTDWINAGIYVLEPSVIDRIADGRRVSIEREVFPAMVADGTLFGLHSPEYWIDTGTPRFYLQSQLDLMSGRRGTRADGVADSASVDDSADVSDSVIADGAVIEAGCVIRSSVVLPGARLKAGSSLERSIVGHRSVVGADSQLHEAVIGDDQEIPDSTSLYGVRVPASE